MNRGTTQEWLADTSPAPSRDSEGIREAWKQGREPEFAVYRPRRVDTREMTDGRQRYPWDQMEPLDFFIVECEPEEMDLVVSRLSSAAVYWFGTHRPECTATVRRTAHGVIVQCVERWEGNATNE